MYNFYVAYRSELFDAIATSDCIIDTNPLRTLTQQLYFFFYCTFSIVSVAMAVFL